MTISPNENSRIVNTTKPKGKTCLVGLPRRLTVQKQNMALYWLLASILSVGSLSQLFGRFYVAIEAFDLFPRIANLDFSAIRIFGIREFRVPTAFRQESQA